MKIRAIIAILTCLLAGCAGSTNALPQATSHAQSSHVNLAIHIPAKPASQPQYVSPSTQSISIAITPSAGCSACSTATTVAANLTSTSANCSSGTGGTTCTIPIALNPGAYTAVIGTYSGVLSSGSPSGNILTSNTAVPLNVVSGSANAFSLTLDGVPASISVAFSNASNSGFYNNGPGLAYLDGSGSTMQFSVSALDAGGNVIVGPGAPTVSATVSGGNGFSAQVAGNVITVTAPAKLPRSSDSMQVQLSSPACSNASASCSTSVGLYSMEHVAGITAGTTSIFETSELPNGPMKGTYTASSGLSGPSAVAFDSKGDLFVSDTTAVKVFEYAYPLGSTPIRTITPPAAPYALIVDHADNLIVTTASNVYVYTAASLYATRATIGNYPAIDLAVSSTDKLYELRSSPAEIATFSGSNYATAGSVITTGLNVPANMTIDANDDVWVANQGTGSNGTVVEYSPTGTVLHTIATGSAASVPALDGSGNLAVQVGSGQVSYYASPAYSSPITEPSSVAPSFDYEGMLLLYSTSNANLLHCFAGTSNCGTEFSAVGTGVYFYGRMALWP